jgi:hypothetical protein
LVSDIEGAGHTQDLSEKGVENMDRRGMK